MYTNRPRRHRENHRDLPVSHGANEVIVDAEGKLAGTGIAAGKVLELIGPKTLRNSPKLLSPGGICCHTGILGGLESLSGFDPITAIPNGCYLTGFYSNYPTQETMAPSTTLSSSTTSNRSSRVFFP